MSAVIELQTKERSGSTAAKHIRQDKGVPGVIYGDQIETRHFSIADNKAQQLVKLGHGSRMLDVLIEGEKEPVKIIIQDIQRHPVSGVLRHLDLYQVRLDRKLHTDVPLEVTGVAPAVKDLSGTLIRQMDSLPIESLPKDLINELAVDISTLATFEDVIRVKDLPLPEGVVTHLDPQQIVASVAAPRTEEEMAALDEEVNDGVADVEVTTEKKEGEEGAEGDVPAEGDTPSKEGEEKKAE